MRLSLLAACLCAAIVYAQNDPAPVRASAVRDLETKAGQRVIVEGYVETAEISGSGIHFLHFRDSSLVCVTFAQHLSRFPEGPPAEIFGEKWVRVTGELSLFRGKPQIKLERPEQIEAIPAPEISAVAEPKEQPPEAPVATEEKKPDTPAENEVELIEGQPPVDWRKYFPE